MLSAKYEGSTVLVSPWKVKIANSDLGIVQNEVLPRTLPENKPSDCLNRFGQRPNIDIFVHMLSWRS